MPTNEEINAARLRGAIARNEADELLLDPDQRGAQNQSDAALSPPRSTAATTRLFSEAFGWDALSPSPHINKNTQQSNGHAGGGSSSKQNS